MEHSPKTLKLHSIVDGNERAVLRMSPLHSAMEEPKVPEPSPLAPTGFVSIFQIFQFSPSSEKGFCSYSRTYIGILLSKI